MSIYIFSFRSVQFTLVDGDVSLLLVVVDVDDDEVELCTTNVVYINNRMS
uniref:Uncharacterized protein n=1 Tax=Arion vulgaris TaxID=1028688 RepID=A0A0B7BU55_9EUPU